MSVNQDRFVQVYHKSSNGLRQVCVPTLILWSYAHSNERKKESTDRNNVGNIRVGQSEFSSESFSDYLVNDLIC